MRKIRKVFIFTSFQVVFCTILAVILVFYGPFQNIRDTFVTSAMATMNHQYLAKLFLSDKQINNILEKSRKGIITASENQNEIVINNNKSNNVQLINIKTNKFRGYLLSIDDPGRVGVGSSDDLGQSGMTLSQIIKKYNAIGGINAGGFSDATGAGTGGVPSGIIIEDHKIKFKDNSTKYGIIGFNDKNVLVIGSYKLEEIKNMGIRDAAYFGPALIINGQPMIVKGDGGKGIQPRTAIGQKRDGTVLLLVIDGRQKDSIGATLKDAQAILLNYGAFNAANLDGGSSATMCYDGKDVNKPSDILGERAIPSAFIIK